ncbi:molecular chaperone TorD family protein [Dehalobacter sp. DCM]|uniref:TorD/DmsD family molecular chaperone n=1 Tax=Dehalobacter sp. DCM TaxID=2907827 RepID=UPI0030819FB9|nr:molecular chaperone TorD family protein [Dehalobacter sp. DCM]
MQNSPELELREALAASDLYQLLAMFFRLPSEELAMGLLDGSLADDVAAIFRELGFKDSELQNIADRLATCQKSSADLKTLVTEMRQEYTRLFYHPKRPVLDIYETMFLYRPEEKSQAKPSLFISPAALDAERCYKKAGLQKSAQVNEPGDHLATEMEFMMYLYLKQATALQANDQEELARRTVEIQEFHHVHLQKWAVSFFEHCGSLTHSTVYRLFSEIGSLYLKKVLADSE